MSADTAPTSDPPPIARPLPRPKAPLAAVLLTALVGAGMLAVVSAGGVVLVVAKEAEPRVAQSKERRERATLERERVEDLDARLDVMAARLASTARSVGELPEMLDEAPPKDPWGRPIQYTRSAPDRAVLSSAGPDGKPGTSDDVRRDVIAR